MKLGLAVGATHSVGKGLQLPNPKSSDAIPLQTTEPLSIMLSQPSFKPSVVTAPDPSKTAGPKYVALLPPNTFLTKFVVVPEPENTAPPPPFWNGITNV